jgi:hypothetical protein
MPLAFAQTTPTTDDASAQSAPPTTQPQAPSPTAQPKQLTWADLDTDKNGSMSKTDVATVPELAQVFDTADANADGQLTAEEYKAQAAKDSGASGDSSGN